MKPVLIVVGALVLILGAALLFVPLVPQPSAGVSRNSPDIFTVSQGFSPTGLVQVTLTWTAASAVEFAVLSCNQVDLSGSSLSNLCRGLSIIGYENGTGGSFTWASKVGATVFAGIFNGSSSATVNVSESSPVLGTILLAAGIALLLAGILLRKKPGPAPVSLPASAFSASPLSASRPSAPAPSVEP